MTPLNSERRLWLKLVLDSLKIRKIMTSKSKNFKMKLSKLKAMTSKKRCFVNVVIGY